MTSLLPEPIAAQLEIDINCDMGEIESAIADGTQDTLMRLISSANIACGAHAGNLEMIAATAESALRCGVAIGAHPGYPDAANFGRRSLLLSESQIADTVSEQVLRVADVARRCGAALDHVKPHGALYNDAARNPAIAEAIALGVAQVTQTAVLVGLAGSQMLEVFTERGFRAISEAFADRSYEADGSLRHRNNPDALLADPGKAADQAASIAINRSVLAINGAIVPIVAQTLCIHGDSPHSLAVATAVRDRLTKEGVAIRPFSPSARIDSSKKK
jgi:UPF0271 protein